MNLNLTEEQRDNLRLAYLEGMVEGITDYAIWRNGEQLVGCMERPLKEVLKPYKVEIESIREKYRSK
jgi:hypothetical protein